MLQKMLTRTYTEWAAQHAFNPVRVPSAMLHSNLQQVKQVIYKLVYVDVEKRVLRHEADDEAQRLLRLGLPGC
jgi:hypothetical protein